MSVAELFDSRRAEDHRRQQLFAECLLDPRHQLDREVAEYPQVEEIVANADCIDAQHLAPNLRELSFSTESDGATNALSSSGREASGSGKRAPIYLPLERQENGPASRTPMGSCAGRSPVSPRRRLLTLGLDRPDISKYATSLESPWPSSRATDDSFLRIRNAE